MHAGSPITLATERRRRGIDEPGVPDRARPARSRGVRRGTSLILVLLLVAILAAAIIQFTVKM